MISVVCPFFNEDSILEGSVELMLRNLHQLGQEWELIIVDDGSTDDSLKLARKLEARHPQLCVVSYARNRGRGYAIRQGVSASRGDLVVTTEIDSSWGDDIVKRIVDEFARRPDADVIVASPHLPGGGYKNVPMSRVILSTLGNYIIRIGLTNRVTMNTGMTRGYRRQRFLDLPLNEDEKEMHLEIINKSVAFGYRIYEIPAILEWRTKKLARISAPKRKSSSKIPKLVRTHMLFTLEVAPFRYIYAGAACMFAMAAFFACWALVRLYLQTPAIYCFLASCLLGLFGFVAVGLGSLAQQNRTLLLQMWRLERRLAEQSHGCISDNEAEIGHSNAA